MKALSSSPPRRVEVRRERQGTHLLGVLVGRVDELEETAQGLDVVLGLQLDDELVDDGRHRVADHARRVGDGAEDVGLDVGDDVGLDVVEVQADVVLEEEAGHGPDRDILARHLGEDVHQVRVVVGDLVERLEAL